MSQFSRSTSTLAGLILLVCSAAYAQEESAPRLLRVDWQPGKAYNLETTTESHTKAGGAEQKLTVTQRTELAVTPAADGSKEVRVTFVRIKGEMSGPAGKASFDTDNPIASNPDLIKSLGTANGKSFVLRYDAANRFITSEDLGMLANIGSGSAATENAAALAEAKDLANLFRKSMEMGLPPGPVGLNDSWVADETLTFPKAGEVHVELSGKFAGKEMYQDRLHAKINFDGKMRSTDPQKAKTVEQGVFSITDKSSVTGLLFYDLERSVVSMSVTSTALELGIGDEKVNFQQKTTTRLTGIQDIRRAIPVEDDPALSKE